MFRPTRSFLVLALLSLLISGAVNAARGGVVSMDGQTATFTSIGDDFVIRWSPEPALAYTQRVVVHAKSAMTRMFDEVVMDKSTEESCQLTPIGNGLLACDLPETITWSPDRIILDPKSQTAMGANFYAAGHMQTWAFVDHWKDGSRNAQDNVLGGVDGRVYWMNIVDYTCGRHMKELSRCNEALLAAAEMTLAERFPPATK